MLSKFFSKSKMMDRNGQELLYEMYYSKVYKTAYYITKDPYLAQDVLQDTFVKAFKGYNDLKDKEKVGAWIGSIATRTAIDALRKEKRWNHLDIQDVSSNDYLNKEAIDSVEKEVERNFLMEEVHASMDKLPPEYRAVLVLKYIHGLKEKEIAEALDLEIGTAKSRIYRAKLKMRTSLERSRIKEG